MSQDVQVKANLLTYSTLLTLESRVDYFPPFIEFLSSLIIITRSNPLLLLDNNNKLADLCIHLYKLVQLVMRECALHTEPTELTPSVWENGILDNFIIFHQLINLLSVSKLAYSAIHHHSWRFHQNMCALVDAY